MHRDLVGIGMLVAGEIKTPAGRSNPADPIDAIAPMPGRGDRVLHRAGGGGAVMNLRAAYAIRRFVRRHAGGHRGGNQQRDDPRISHTESVLPQ